MYPHSISLWETAVGATPRLTVISNYLGASVNKVQGQRLEIFMQVLVMCNVNGHDMGTTADAQPKQTNRMQTWIFACDTA